MFKILTIHICSVKWYQQSKIDTIFQFGIAVLFQYCDNWQFDIHNAAEVQVYVFPLLCLNVVRKLIEATL